MSVLLALLLGIGAPSPATTYPVSAAAQERIDVEFQDADIHFVLRTLADIGRVNIVAEAGVKGRVTARLRHTTWREALDRILVSQHLEAEYDGNMVFVRPRR
jgi:type IV pilus assembly protein PilQ